MQPNPWKIFGLLLSYLHYATCIALIKVECPTLRIHTPYPTRHVNLRFNIDQSLIYQAFSLLTTHGEHSTTLSSHHIGHSCP